MKVFPALRSGAEYIISRNVRDYPYNDIPVITPSSFLKEMGVE